jgi:Tfp pilus assembly protein PilO
MKLSNTQKKLIIVLLVAIMSIVFYCGFFIVIKNKNNQISILKNQVDIEIRKDQRLHSVKQLMMDLNEEINKINSRFVSNDGVVKLLEDLESLGKVSGASIGVNSVSVESNKDTNLPYELLKIEFVSRGSWRSVVQTISLLETISLGINIERMQLERLPKSNSWQMNASFTVLKLD